jgi:hypothetical protein
MLKDPDTQASYLISFGLFQALSFISAVFNISSHIIPPTRTHNATAYFWNSGTQTRRSRCVTLAQFLTKNGKLQTIPRTFLTANDAQGTGLLLE